MWEEVVVAYFTLPALSRHFSEASEEEHEKSHKGYPDLDSNVARPAGVRFGA
jgi:hypothetical protein